MVWNRFILDLRPTSARGSVFTLEISAPILLKAGFAIIAALTGKDMKSRNFTMNHVCVKNIQLVEYNIINPLTRK
jgi:hypothetical protein